LSNFGGNYSSAQENIDLNSKSNGQQFPYTFNNNVMNNLMSSSQSSIQSSTMQQPLLQFKPINIVAQQNANYNSEESFLQQNNSATINNSQQHLQSMPLLNADLLITPNSKPSGQGITGSYNLRSFSFPPYGVINNFANLRKTSNSTTQYRQPTPPLFHQRSNGSHKFHNLGNNSLYVNSNPPTPVDLPMVPTVHPSTSQYHSLIGNNRNCSNSIIGPNYNNNAAGTSSILVCQPAS
ncbi:11236_t:CDS:2, partial [Ambispora leptoticha]